jgi:hypothetical protein
MQRARLVLVPRARVGDSAWVGKSHDGLVATIHSNGNGHWHRRCWIAQAPQPEGARAGLPVTGGKFR